MHPHQTKRPGSPTRRQALPWVMVWQQGSDPESVAVKHPAPSPRVVWVTVRSSARGLGWAVVAFSSARPVASPSRSARVRRWAALLVRDRPVVQRWVALSVTARVMVRRPPCRSQRGVSRQAPQAIHRRPGTRRGGARPSRWRAPEGSYRRPVDISERLARSNRAPANPSAATHDTPHRSCGSETRTDADADHSTRRDASARDSGRSKRRLQVGPRRSTPPVVVLVGSVR